MSTANHAVSSKENQRARYLAGLDIGCSKVTVVIGHEVDGRIEVVGLGNVACSGIRKGVVVNIDATTDAIQQAKDEAELMAGVAIDRVFVSIGGGHIKSFESKGMIAIADNEVTDSDIHRVIEAAKAVAVPSDREVVHVLPKDFKVDEQDGISDPVGMSGVRLEASVHIVTGGQTAIQNAIKCTRKAGLDVIQFVLQPMASALCCLSEDEKKLGAIVADIGSGTTDIVIYHQGSVSYTDSIPVGGSHITNDIAVGMRTPQGFAEELKKDFGAAIASVVDSEDSVEIDGVGGRNHRTVRRRDLCEIIEPRAEEVLNMLRDSIERSGLSQLLGSGVILTGGTSLLEGMTELGEYIIDMPVRRGAATDVGGLSETVRSPMFATAVGLLYFAKSQGNADAIREQVEPSFLVGVKRRLQNLFDKNSLEA
ncbi:MAG: cell division protein FtsA [Bdellovibrionales bacterium]